MNKRGLLKFKKSLVESSRIINSTILSKPDQDLSSRLHFSLLPLTGSNSPSKACGFSGHSQCTNTSQALLKRLPEIISQNDELRTQVFQLKQLLQLASTKNTHELKTNSLRINKYALQPENLIHSKKHPSSYSTPSIYLNSSNKKNSIQMTSLYPHREINQVSQKVYRKGMIQTDHPESMISCKFQTFYQREIQKLKKEKCFLEYQITVLKKSMDLKDAQLERERKRCGFLESEMEEVLRRKVKLGLEIDEFLIKFDKVIQEKEALFREQQCSGEGARLSLNQTIESLQIQLQLRDKEASEILAQIASSDLQIAELTSFKDSSHLFIQQIQSLKQMLRQTPQRFLWQQSIQHLWKIKEVEFQNAQNVLISLYFHQ